MTLIHKLFHKNKAPVLPPHSEVGFARRALDLEPEHPLEAVLTLCEERAEAVLNALLVQNWPEGPALPERVMKLQGMGATTRQWSLESIRQDMETLADKGVPERIVGTTLPHLTRRVDVVRPITPFEKTHGLLPLGSVFGDSEIHKMGLTADKLGKILYQAGFNGGMALDRLESGTWLHTAMDERCPIRLSSQVLRGHHHYGHIAEWAVATHFGATLDRLAADVFTDVVNEREDVAGWTFRARGIQAQHANTRDSVEMVMAGVAAMQNIPHDEDCSEPYYEAVAPFIAGLRRLRADTGLNY